MRTRAKSHQQQQQGCALPQRNSSSDAPPLSTKPFLSQDVFRLVVRLEAQKVLGDVDVGALERKFRVPLGYSEEDTHRKQEKLELDNLPGPGAYEVEDPWKLENALHQSAIFASRIDRDPYQLGSPRAKSASRQVISSLLPSPVHNSSTVLDPQPALGSFSRSSRGLEIEPGSRRRRTRIRDHQHRGHQDLVTQPQSPPPVVRSLLSTQSAVFPRVAKEKHSFIPVSDRDLGPGLYDIRRFWDARSPSVEDPDELQQTWASNIQSDKPTSAAFGASREKRELMWSPARNPPSYAAPEAWNASPNYAKQKSKVLATAEREARRKKEISELKKSKMRLQSSQSTPGLSSLKHSTRFPVSSSTSAGNESLDPFEWLRRQPRGEQRVNLLATKYGLLDQVRTLHHHHHTPEDSGPGHHQQRPVLSQQNSQQDLSHHLQNNNNGSDLGQGDPGQAQPQDAALNERDEHIVISCRMPGGLMLSATLFSRKKVRHLKSAIVHKSRRRFTSDEQFDLVLPNGRKLANLEDTLNACGLTTRSLVQIVPVSATVSQPPIGTSSLGPAPAAPDTQG